MRNLLTALFGLFLCGHSVAQTYFFRKYGVEDGLPRSGAFSLCEDKDGYLWVGTDGGGVAVFDGYDFELLDEKDGLPSLYVRKIIQDKQGRMWLGTIEGIRVIDDQKGWNIGAEHGLQDVFIRAMAEDPEGNIWAGTDKGIFILQDSLVIGRITPADGLLHNKVSTIVRASDGVMWVGTDDGLCLFRGRKLIRSMTMDDGLASSNILYLFEAQDKGMWVGTKYGMACIHGKKVVCYHKEEFLTHMRVRAITQDKNGDMWFGTWEGLNRFDGKNFLQITEDNGLNHNRIRDLITDRNGNVWVATYFGGISRYCGDPFVRFGLKEGLPDNKVTAVHGNGNGLLVTGTETGIALCSYSTSISVKLDTLHIWPKVEARALWIDSDSTIWAATPFGLFHLKQTGDPEVYGYVEGIRNDDLYCMMKAGNGFWLGTQDGVSFINPFADKPLVRNFLPSDRKELLITSLARLPDGRIVAGHRHGSLYLVDEKNGALTRIEVDGLKNVTALQVDNNLLVVSTDGFGIFALDPSTFKVVGHLSKSGTGLSSDHIYLLQKGTGNTWWTGSQRGLDRIHTNFTAPPERLKFYGGREGFFGFETSERASFMDNKGYLWVGTVDGLVVFNPMGAQWNTTPPLIHLTGIYINGKKWTQFENGTFGDQYGRHGVPLSMILPYSGNNLTFTFTGINLSKPNLTRYKWQLEGFEDTWHGPYPRRDIVYTNLPPGEYRLLIVGCNEDGKCSDPVEAMVVIIEPAFWQTTWFIILSVIALIALVFLLSQWRVKRLRAAKLRLEAVVEERTFELRQEKERVEEQNERINRQREALEEYTKAVTDSINYARRIQSAMMKPANPETGWLAGRVFILYRPKDIVSGDFFWYNETEDITYITAADCTGHGVPGALMSMIGIAYLNEIMRSWHLPATDLVLNELRNKIIQGVAGSSKDGMDMAMCSINRSTLHVQFSGANNPMFVLRAGQLMEFRADKMPIGEHDLRSQPFTLHQHQGQPGDLIYLFSDGYPDQFGGDRGKKLMYKRFKEILLQGAAQPVQQQKLFLEKELDLWMTGYEQVDDILVIGIQL
jgi:ligand-binding sensor domain-containing protein/serine phosphatase RsbU (regulator of sigma subunit)